MRTFTRPAVWGLLWLAFSAASFATNLTITSQPENVNGGGEFVAYLDNNSNATFNVFCVDYRNDISGFNLSFPVNVSTLTSLGIPTNTDVGNTRYGTTPSGSFAFDTSSPDAGTAQNRYLLAAYLTTQYDFSGGVNAADYAIQDAIWTLLNVDGAQEWTLNSTQTDVNTAIQNAINWETGLSAQQLSDFAGRVEIFTSTDVAGATIPDRYAIGQQEYVTVTSATPEPAALALVGIGLVGLGLLRRRKSA
ncbi:MAG: PEP-CTERM sorting domain-containing protein [Acidobacteriia bacterium]|nr:PEP-CTERM sorting domain-containing protein [Terriglobia bacterium]